MPHAKAWTSLSFLTGLVIAVLIVDMAYVASFGPAYVPGQQCTNPTTTTILSITQNRTFNPIPSKRSLNPPCSSFVQLSGRIIPGSIEIGISEKLFGGWGGANYDCALFPTGVWCDSDFNLQPINSNQTCNTPMNGGYPSCSNNWNWIHVEIDKNWKAAGIAPSEPPQRCWTGCVISLQGFVYFDSGHLGSNGGNGWEIHPVASYTVNS